MEKIIGLLILLLGFITFYEAYINIPSIGSALMLFLALGIALIAIGVFIVIAKAE
jgi:hypothetical protein